MKVGGGTSNKTIDLGEKSDTSPPHLVRVSWLRLGRGLCPVTSGGEARLASAGSEGAIRIGDPAASRQTAFLGRHQGRVIALYRVASAARHASPPPAPSAAMNGYVNWPEERVVEAGEEGHEFWPATGSRSLETWCGLAATRRSAWPGVPGAFQCALSIGLAGTRSGSTA